VSRLIDKREVLRRVGLSYPTVWKRMRKGTFPRCRISGGKSVWFEDEIEAWMEGLPKRRLKGDPPEQQIDQTPKMASGGG
jgi:predicted DNA-binding transcriptional regulator AlpA